MDIVPSPCERVCVMADDLCQGCGRTLAEISQWRVMTNEEKRLVWQRLNTEFKQTKQNKG